MNVLILTSLLILGGLYVRKLDKTIRTKLDELEKRLNINYDWFDKNLPRHIVDEYDIEQFVNFSDKIANNIGLIKNFLETANSDQKLDVKIRMAKLNYEYTLYKVKIYDELRKFLILYCPFLSDKSFNAVQEWIQSDLEDSKQVSLVYLDFVESMGV